MHGTSSDRMGRPRPRPGGERGVSLLVAVISLVFIIPMLGLSIDVGVLYVVKTRLQSSVDGAALAAARALSAGATIQAQAATAKQNAVNWFFANFPTGNWATSSTQMTASSVTVADDPNNARLRNVTVSATTQAPTYFMKWLGFNSVTVSATGNASRRDVVAMLVLDRSGSMGGTCADMIEAAKLFTGQFAACRDSVGLISYATNLTLHSSPTTNFQAVLGYQNSSGSGAGMLDTISCSGGTGTAHAVSAAYNELYRAGQPGALNVIVLETDGLPNLLVMDFWDGEAGIAAGSGCRDKNNKTKPGGGFTAKGILPDWTPGVTFPSGSWKSGIPAGMVGQVYASDPNQGQWFSLLYNYWSSGSLVSSTAAAGCSFPSNSQSTADFAWWPAQDVWGNELNPSTNRYKPVTANGSRVAKNGWADFRNAVLNATDRAAFQARTNSTLQATMFVIGLGGNGADPPDYTLLQRMANDPEGDDFNDPPRYQSCASQPGCVHFPDQPRGKFMMSPDASDLRRAFLSISSQILRLSR